MPLTIRQCFEDTKSLASRYGVEITYAAVASLSKVVASKFAVNTAATISKKTIAADGSRDYTLSPRVGNIYLVIMNNGSNSYPIEGYMLNRHIEELGYRPTVSGTPAYGWTVFGRTFRVSPQPPTGSTFDIFHSAKPVLALRDTDDENIGELVDSGSTTTTITVASLRTTPSVVNNLAGDTDYFDNCEITSSGVVTLGQRSYVTNYNEPAAGVRTFTINPAFSAGMIAAEKFFMRDVVEIDDGYAQAATFFCAGTLCGKDKNNRPVAPIFLEEYERMYNDARNRPFATHPGTQLKFTSPNSLAFPGMQYGRGIPGAH